MSRPFTFIVAIFFIIAAIVHVLRLYSHWVIVINGIVIPPWASMVFIAIALPLALLLMREARR